MVNALLAAQLSKSAILLQQAVPQIRRLSLHTYVLINIHFCVVGNGRCAIRFGWNHGNSAALVQYGTQGVVIESFVGNESLEIDACDQRFDADAIVTLAGQQDKARQVTQRVDESNDLGCQPATRFADSLILSPPFAPVPCR